MTHNPPGKCPVSGDQVSASQLLEGHDLRWDIAESADAICPWPGTGVGSLEDCAKEAWRNSVRCIGRSVWRALKVIDARTVSSHDEVFEALHNHLKMATNDGKILPVMTVFKEWSPEDLEIRIWNHQLLRYAGYEKGDGTILGDPMNTHLTKRAISSPWGGVPQKSLVPSTSCRSLFR